MFSILVEIRFKRHLLGTSIVIYKTCFPNDNILNTKKFTKFVIFQLNLEKAV